MLHSAAGDQPVDQEENDGPDDGGDEAGALACAIPANGMTDPACQQSTGDPKQDRNDAPARIASGRQQLRDRAGDSADDDPADDSVMFHAASPCFPGSFNRPSTAVGQRALAKQVPRLVEKQWRRMLRRGLLHGVSY